MIIELCGIPGCGKSEITKELNKTFGFRFFNDYYKGRLNRILYKIDCYLYPQIIFYKDKSIKKLLSNFHHYDKKYAMNLYRLVFMLKHKANDKNVYVLDEGLLQHITSLYFGEYLEINNDMINALRNISSNTLIVVFCDCESEIASKRIANRRSQKGRYYLLKEEERMKYLDIKRDNINALLNIYNKEIIRINNNDSFDNLKVILLDKINEKMTR